MNGNRLAGLIADNGDHDFLVHRDIYRDPEVFEWEMRYIFEGTWNLIGLESQVPNPYDFITAHIGRTPVIISRDAQGKLHCVVNSCRHKGALVCHKQQGSARTFVCQYHGWAYDNGGKNILIKNHREGGYAEAFDCQNHNLQPVARFASYRGVMFASLNHDVPELEDYLGDMRKMIDLVVDQSPNGVECIAGHINYTFNGNWKLQLENGVDPYHFSSTHTSYIQTLKRRDSQASVYSTFKSAELERGTFGFAHGHNAMWGPAPSDKATPLSYAREELELRVGQTKARWMTYVRNITAFPNAQFAENASLQLRIWRPLSADKTEMKTFCLAPVGESAEARRLRIRQYEEFFNPSGLATPDDIANYEDCQRGFAGASVEWQQGHARGATCSSGEVPEAAKELGITPLSCVIGAFNLGDETVMHSTYRYWKALIQKGLDQDTSKGESE